MRELIPGYRCPDPVRTRRLLRAWFETGLGQAVLDSERLLLDQVLSNLFGYYLVQLGQPAPVDLLGASRIRNATILVQDGHDLQLPPGSRAELGIAAETALPIASDSLDVLLLPHTLDFSSAPHQVLREADRVLIPEGRLVLLGFNPFGFWGLLRLLLARRGQVPWCANFFSAGRIRDWLALLGFDTVCARSYFFRPPLQQTSLMQRLRFLERAGERWYPPLGAGYLLVARKRVATVTPIRPRWRPRRALMPGGLAKPTMRQR